VAVALDRDHRALRRPLSAPSTELRIGAKEALGVLGLACVWALVVRPGPLSLPYFWDEADVYAPGARWLADHDMSPTPGHFPDVWSRGHPPLLYLIAAVVFRVLGPGPAVGHAITVPFTALALAATYVLGAELAGAARQGRIVGAFAFAMLATSPLFMSMSAFLLPEMPLTALTVLAFVLAHRGRLGWAAFVGVLLVWTKETGVGPPIAIAGGLVVEALAKPGDRRANLRASARGVGISLLPVVALAAFFVWQRATAGYFVFPHHQALFTDRPFGFWNVATVIPSIFEWHGRWVVTLAACVAALALYVRGRSWRNLPTDRTSVAIVLLLLGNAVFFAKMFWLERYALPVHPGICVLLVMVIGAAARELPERSRVALAAAPVGIASVLGLASLHETSGAHEHTFAFADVVRSHEEALAWLAEADEDALVLTTWPFTTEMREPWLGFVDAPLRAMGPDALDEDPPRVPDLVLVDPSSSRRDRLREVARARGLRVLTTVQHGTSPALEIWGPALGSSGTSVGGP
jgi:hypothetical protein